jgi:hypothetical protein
MEDVTPKMIPSEEEVTDVTPNLEVKRYEHFSKSVDCD